MFQSTLLSKLHNCNIFHDLKPLVTQLIWITHYNGPRLKYIFNKTVQEASMKVLPIYNNNNNRCIYYYAIEIIARQVG